MNAPTTQTVHPLGQPTIMPIERITPYERNPRKITAKAVEQVAKSIRDFGWQQPIVVDGAGYIIIGHVRFAAAQSLGLTEVPVVVEDRLSAEALRALRVADNRAHDYTTWDYPTLVEELKGMGEDFADVLDLTDWSGLMTAFEAQAGAQVHQLPPEADASDILPGTGYTLSVEFNSRDDADRAGPALMAIPGVLNVRHTVR